MTQELIHLARATKRYRTDEIETTALRDVNVSINCGEFVAITGRSGSGKSTLLNILGLLDVPDLGEYRFFGRDVMSARDEELTELRRGQIGFVFQSYNLIGELTVEENVALALRYAGLTVAEQRERTFNALQQVDLAARAKHRPGQLSGGQQQRAAIARAFAGRPPIVLADEPTGNLDSENGAMVMRLLSDLVAHGTTVVMVTHSSEQALAAQRIYAMKDGMIDAVDHARH